MPTKYKFRDIGPIRDAELQLGDLTIIAGRNNTGKTYLVYTLYGFIKACKALNDTSELFAYVRDQSNIFSGINQSLQDLNTSRVVEYSLSGKALAEQRVMLFNLLSNRFSRAFIPHVISTRSGEFMSSTFEAHLIPDENMRPCKLQQRISDHISLSIESDGRSIQLIATRRSGERIDSRLSRDIVNAYFQFLLEAEFPSTFLLSSERFGISLFYKELDFTKHQLVDLLQKIGDEKSRHAAEFPFFIVDQSVSRYALPIKDNIDYTRSMSDRKTRKSDIADTKLDIQIKNMMNGYYRMADDDIRFVSKTRGRDKFNIPLHLASSSARGLSDFYFFLQHDAESSGLIIIDEPESHLDTKNQILMARLLVRLVHAGVRVLITTHSDYLIKEFNNLIMLSHAVKRQDTVVKELKYEADDALDPCSVRAYVAEDGGLRECEIDKYGIDMPVFDTTIDEINRTSNRLVFLANDTEMDPSDAC